MIKFTLLIISFLVSVVLILSTPWVPDDYKYYQLSVLLLKSIGTSLMAAVLFAVFYSIFSDHINNSLLETRLDSLNRSISKTNQSVTGIENKVSDQVKLLITNELQEIRGRDPKIAPIYSYNATDVPNPSYNAVYEEHLQKTRTLKYKSDRGLFLTYRIHEQIAQNEISKFTFYILLTNPEHPELFTQRAITLKEYSKFRSLTTDRIISQLRKETLSCLVALLDTKPSDTGCRFEVALSNEVPFLRYEILEDILIVSVLPMQKHGYYPPTLIYGRSSYFYEAYEANFQTLFDRAKRENSFFTHQDLKRESIEQLISKCNLETDLGELRDIYDEYYQKVRSSA